ncbi:hypothetical protein FOZ61_001385, partial [Perkinsus olseni]
MPEFTNFAAIAVLCIVALSCLTDASSGRHLSVSQFISSTPSPIDIEMYYSRANSSKPVKCFNFTIENSGTGSEIIDFDDIPRYLKAHQVLDSPQIHPLVDRATRVGQAGSYGQGPNNTGVAAANKCRIIFDLTTVPYFDVDSNLSIPVNLTATMYHLMMLQIGVIEIVGTNDPSPFVQQMRMMGIVAEEDYPIELAAQSRRALSLSPPDDTYFGQQWALDDMRVKRIVDDRLADPDTGCEQDDSSPVTVALIDSGVDYGHPDL